MIYNIITDTLSPASELPSQQQQQQQDHPAPQNANESSPSKQQPVGSGGGGKPSGQEAQPAHNQAGQKAAQYHHTMSCYACTTMDYENPHDNLCRDMRKFLHHRSPAGLTTTTVGHQKHSSTVSIGTSSTAAGPEAADSTSNGTASHHQQRHGYFPQNRPLMSTGGFIRKRACFEDENFCSIVSVVRLEFANDTLITKFWAMER